LEFNVLYSTNTAISETKGQGWRVVLSQWRKARVELSG